VLLATKYACPPATTVVTDNRPNRKAPPFGAERGLDIERGADGALPSQFA
jgi:hypothetical protein